LEEQRLKNIAELDLLRISQRIAGEDDRSPLSVLKRPQPAILALGEEVRTPQTVRRPGTHYQNGWCSCGLNHLTRVHRVRRDGC
jgi:hypothetical protein